MRLIHLLSISSLVWLLYCMYVYILHLFEKYFFHSYCRKIIDKQHFPYILTVRSGISEASVLIICH